MKKFHFQKKRGENYKKFLTNLFGGEIINEHLIAIDNENAKGEIIVFERENMRSLVLNYKANINFTTILEHDDNFDYTIRCYQPTASYKGQDNTTIDLKCPLGFIINQRNDVLTLSKKEGDDVQAVAFFFNQEKLTKETIPIINKIKSFSFNMGDERFIRWNKNFFNNDRSFVNNSLYTKWAEHKLNELYVIIENIILENEEEESEKMYHDYEIDIALQVKNRIANELNYKPNIEEISKEFGINKTKIGVVYKFIYGQTIYQDYKKVRIFRAKDMISSTTRKISDIAYELGYTDLHHLSKDFKKTFDITPSELRESVKE
ncbi:AraC family transcriptional regulator [Flammeovirga pectinis]|uniref:AraC family transcriptional regulator n=1 Tax=Flammeovirga pectinis TaxID=2494373 RepID=A0A3Q9FUB9_9BACT|nr:AraC family transcriptional regulator [Flammeovirga pectinis]AZQ64742.1 AraC family transcriptional regulator [Flammeovirga pectinis]